MPQCFRYCVSLFPIHLNASTYAQVVEHVSVPEIDIHVFQPKSFISSIKLHFTFLHTHSVCRKSIDSDQNSENLRSDVYIATIIIFLPDIRIKAVRWDSTIIRTQDLSPKMRKWMISPRLLNGNEQKLIIFHHSFELFSFGYSSVQKCAREIKCEKSIIKSRFATWLKRFWLDFKWTI